MAHLADNTTNFVRRFATRGRPLASHNFDLRAARHAGTRTRGKHFGNICITLILKFDLHGRNLGAARGFIRCWGKAQGQGATTTLDFFPFGNSTAGPTGQTDQSGSIRIGPFEVFLPKPGTTPSLLPSNGSGYPGRLFIVEGIDGSGKSTQLMLLHKWLESRGYGVVFSEWNSSPLVKDTTKLGKKKKMLTPATFSLIHATDFADRTEKSILPLMKAGAVVLCDRYVYTAFARDVARGMDRKWVRDLYGFAVPSTVAFYFRVPLETAIGRITAARDCLKFYEAGMDLGLSDDPVESFRIFQGKILDEYERMIPEFGLTVIDATLPVEVQQAQVRRIAKMHLDEATELRVRP